MKRESQSGLLLSRAFTPQSSSSSSALEWSHWDLSQSDARDQICRLSELDTVVAEALMAPETRPRCTKHDGGAILILRGVNLNEGADPEDMVSVRIWASEKQIVSGQLRRVRAIEDVANRAESPEGPHLAGSLVVGIASRLTDRMEKIIDDATAAIEVYETFDHSSHSERDRQNLAEVRRRVTTLRRFIAPQRDALRSLAEGSYSWLSQDDRAILLETIDQTTRYVEELDETQQRAVIVQDEIATAIAERMNLTMFVLALVGGVFLPLSFVTGLLGINVGGIPFSDSPFGFLIVCVFLLVCAGAVYWLFKKYRLI